MDWRKEVLLLFKYLVAAFTIRFFSDTWRSCQVFSFRHRCLLWRWHDIVVVWWLKCRTVVGQLEVKVGVDRVRRQTLSLALVARSRIRLERALRWSFATIPLLAETGLRSCSTRVGEDAAITCHGISWLIQALFDGYFWVIDKWLANVLIVHLVFFRDWQGFDDWCTRYLGQVAELYMMIVFCRA